MKREIVVLMCVLSIASFSFGDVVIGNFEDDGMDVPMWFNSDPGDVTVQQGTTGATVGNNALTISSINGGWGSFAVAFDLMGSPAKDALGSVGTVLIDATPIPAWELPENGGWPASWGSFELLLNCQGYWGWTGSVVNLNVWDPATQTLEFQLDASQMAAVAAATDYCNLELQISTGDNTQDPITQTWQYPQMGTAYVDNVRVVPEPATLSLLGLGALVLRRRK